MNKRKEQFNQAQQPLHGNAIALVLDFQSALNLQGQDGQFFEVSSRSHPDLDNIEIWVFSRPATAPLHPHPLLPILLQSITLHFTPLKLTPFHFASLQFKILYSTLLHFAILSLIPLRFTWVAIAILAV